MQQSRFSGFAHKALKITSQEAPGAPTIDPNIPPGGPKTLKICPRSFLEAPRPHQVNLFRPRAAPRAIWELPARPSGGPFGRACSRGASGGPLGVMLVPFWKRCCLDFGRIWDEIAKPNDSEWPLYLSTHFSEARALCSSVGSIK